MVFFVVLILVAIACRFGSSYFRKQHEKQTPDRFGQTNNVAGMWARILRIATWAVAAFAVFVLVGSSVSQVDNGHVGLVSTFGKITSQRNPGAIITWPWQTVAQVNTQTQKEVPPDTCSDQTPHCLEVPSKEAQTVFISTVTNVSVDRVNVQTLYKSIGPDFIDKIVQPRVAQIVKEETAKYNAKDIIPNRAKLRTDIATRLKAELAADSITVEDFLIPDLHFSAAYEQAIENNVIAEQNSLTEQSNVAVHEAQAAQKVADAQGVADSNVVLAKGQAESNNVVDASLTPELIEYTAVQKLNPNVQVMIVPAANGLILDVGSLMQPTSGQPDTGS